MARVLSRDEVEQLLDMGQVVDWMADAFRALSDGSAVVPVRSFLQLPNSDDGLLVMPAWRPDAEPGSGFYAVKIVSLVHSNPGRGLPFARATVLVMESETGELLGVIEGEQLTAVRTGAGSGLATRLMSREDSSKLAVVGAGRQAATQIEAVCAVRNIETCAIVSRHADSGKAFARQMADQHGIVVQWFSREDATATNALQEADVICLATNSAEPVLFANDVSPGTHINGVGSHRPDMAEASADLVAASHVIVDQLAACLQEAGDLVIPILTRQISVEHVAGELGDVVNGTVPGRPSADDITFFKSVGNGVQDLYVACELYRKAVSNDVGLVVDLG